MPELVLRKSVDLQTTVEPLASGLRQGSVNLSFYVCSQKDRIFEIFCGPKSDSAGVCVCMGWGWGEAEGGSTQEAFCEGSRTLSCSFYKNIKISQSDLLCLRHIYIYTHIYIYIYIHTHTHTHIYTYRSMV